MRTLARNSMTVIDQCISALNRLRSLPEALSSTIFVSVVLLTACEATPPESFDPKAKNFQVTDFEIVDCLLPGLIRQLGNTSYQAASRPTRTTAADCRVRGGEYTAYDRADYRTALNVWLAAAEAGDAEAQTNVGEIFERGHGGEPNYIAAASWYKKAADQGNTRAQFNLGTLYEQGLGVTKDKLAALNLYREAWGLSEDDILYQSVAYQEQQSLRQELEAQLSKRQRKIDLLNRQIEQLKQEIDAQAKISQEKSQLQIDLAELQQLVEEFKQDKKETETQVASLPKVREAVAVMPPKPTVNLKPAVASPDRKEFGKYYALVIGIQDYGRLDDLTTPYNDARQVATLLQNRYGFSVQTLLDANNVEVMQAINNLNSVINENDNLLIYYAGHGSRIQAGDYENGYWLPINADPPPTDTFWVSNEFITRHLAVIKAKRVLVVADSCYAGLLSSSPGHLFTGLDQSYDEKYLRYKLAKKSRLLLASGTDQPVLDNAGDGHSIFARAFIEVLSHNDKVITGPELFVQVNKQVTEKAQATGFEQQPEFKAIKGAGHEVGDFFFVPQSI